MKRVCSYLLVLVPFALPGSTPSVTAQEGKATLSFATTKHDFGMVSPRSENHCEFPFENSGQVDLFITGEIETACGCTVATLEKRRYAPGEKGKIQVTFTATGTIAHVTKEIHVHSNDPNQSLSTLTIQAHVTPRVVCEPSPLKLLPKRENGQCPPVTLHSLDGVPFAITGVTSSLNCISAPFDAEAASATITLTPIIDRERLRVPGTGFLIFKLSHPDCPEARVRFETLPDFQFEPRRLALYGVDPHQPVVRRVRLLNNYGEPFDIESIESEKGIVSVRHQAPLPPSEGGLTGYVLEIVITPPARSQASRSFWDNLVVRLSDGQTLKLPSPGFFSATHR